MITKVGVTRDDARDLLLLGSEFPSLAFGGTEKEADLVVTLAAWPRRDHDLAAFDGRVDRLEGDAPRTLFLAAGAPGEAARAPEVLTRCQRLFGRTNAASSETVFARVLSLHRALHDVKKPLVRADLNHALDAWQWVLRLDPEASAAIQLAALFHDVERLASEADARVEQHAKDHVAFKEVHARAGASMADRVLSGAGVPAEVRGRTAELIAAHERPPGQGERDRERRVLTDADALSFFSLNCGGYYRYFGPARTWEKVGYSLARLSPAARRRLSGVRLPAEIAAMVGELKDVPYGAVARPLVNLTAISGEVSRSSFANVASISASAFDSSFDSTSDSSLAFA